MNPEIQVRLFTPEEYEPWTRVVLQSFGYTPTDEHFEVRKPLMEYDKTLAAFEGDKIVGGAMSMAWQLSLPGGNVVPMEFVDYVATLPTHRRRGIMRSLMDRQLASMHERGVAFAGLGASEGGVYGRFGYGIGAMGERWTIDREHTTYAAPFEREGSTRLVDQEEATTLFREISMRLGSSRPATKIQGDASWNMAMSDPTYRRRGGSAFFYVAYQEGDRATGYAMYRIKDDRVQVIDLAAETMEAYRGLWRCCFDVDLTAGVGAPVRPVGEPLPWMLADPRRLLRSVEDWWWLRLVDVRAALGARSYSTNGDLVHEVRDPVCPWNEGKYRLDGGPDGARCQPTGDAPDLTLSASDLASAYLGAITLGALKRAGRVVEHTPGSQRLADAMFTVRSNSWKSLQEAA